MDLIVSRHGESIEAARRTANGDPGTDPGLTAAGREQAEQLGRQLAGDEIDLCITSEFPRAQQTAAMALAGRELECVVDSNLNDIQYGEFEGRPIDEYRTWAHKHPLSMAPPAGESRVEVARRLCTALQHILDLPQRRALVVTHEKLIADLLAVADGRPPEQTRPDIPYASGYRLSAGDVRDAIALLGSWIGDQSDAATT